MNRNVESHFSMLPSANISRSRFDRSCDNKLTFNVGELIPFFIDEVMPGDTYDVTSSKVVRLQTLLTPVMDNIYLDVYWFFVPYRLVWTHWRELMGENRASAWLPAASYSVPQIKASTDYLNLPGLNQIRSYSIFDYLGIPVIDDGPTVGTVKDFTFSALPYRAYCLIFNEWFRDENLTDPVNWSDGDSTVTVYSIQGAASGSGEPEDGDKPFKVAKYHDYFTSALPSAQKGPPVSIPAGFNTAIGPGWPVITTGKDDTSVTISTNRNPLLFYGSYGNTSPGDPITTPYMVSGNVRNAADDGSVPSFGRGSAASSTSGVYPANLFAAPAVNSGTGLYMLVNDLRYAFQLQKLYERDARGGTRYIELIKSHFGVVSPDARMQRPEYLGGNRISISIHQIVNQSQGESDFLGDLGAMSLTTDKNHDFVKSFTEHGVVCGVLCARYDHSYPQGLERFWSRKTRFDFYWPVFANLGEQAILKKEIMLTGDSTDDEVFGFQERWAEYRYKPNRVCGEMRPGISNTLDSWHFADYYDQVPTLSDDWIREDKTNVDRTLAVTSNLANQIFADIYVKCFATRPMPLYSIPGLIDHH